MSETPDCLAPEQLRQLAESELTGAELATAQAHLSSCPSCRAALDETLAQSDQWKSTGASSGTDRVPAADRDEESLPSRYLGVLSLLAASNNPEHLGRIANYEIVGILGQGGMGVVFKGFDTSLNRHVAIKMLLPHLAASGAARKQFAREAQAAAAVVDDHVIAIYTVAEWQGAPYFVMPYVQGVSLHDRLKAKRPLELTEILRIGAQTARGLAAAHKQGLIHRDVKPANILLPEGTQRISLTDFGLARAVDDASMTKTDAIVGTPRYMSPEQARGESVDFRSDLFSLGSVLYAMCAGEPPFRAESNYGVLRLITDEAPRPIAEINRTIPDWLCRIINKLMDKQPEQRFGSAREVGELLERCLAHVQNPTSAELPPTIAEPSPPAKPPVRQLSGIIALTVAAAAILILGWAVIANMFDWPSNSAASKNERLAKPELATIEQQRAAKAAVFANTTLQGTWQMVKGVNAESVEADATYMSTITFVVHSSTLEMRNAVDPKSTLIAQFTINAAKFPIDGGPKRLDFIDYMEKDADGTLHPMVALCDADATTLKICWGPKVPAKLEPAPGFLYAELRKVPDPPPHDTPAAQPGAKAP